MESKSMETGLRPIVKPLLSWYDAQARVLPWREDPTPYKVWISEIMLQQTRVEAVKPYFERFLSALPDVYALASAQEDTLLKLWEGLGYYSRVRNLQKAAKVIVNEYAGRLPRDPALLQRLPGIGPYTAGAIASISYGEPVPAVDGNVLRVTSRILASRDEITLPAVKKAVEKAVGLIIPKDRAGDFNQALMELGAMVCLPNGVAKCEECPVRAVCKGCQQGIAMQLPVKSPKKVRRIEERTVLVLLSEHRVALRRRPAKGLLAGMWEFPNLESHMPAAQALALLDIRQEPKSLEVLAEAKHIFSHVEWHMQAFLLRFTHIPDGGALEWVTLRQLREEYALPGAFQTYRSEAEARLSDPEWM